MFAGENDLSAEPLIPVMNRAYKTASLTTLPAGAKWIAVSCDTLPDGARLTFNTDDRRLLSAIHRWFGRNYPGTARMPGAK